MAHSFLHALMMVGVLASASCDQPKQEPDAAHRLDSAEDEDGFTALFDGESLRGWFDGKGRAVTKGWVVEDGCLHHRGSGGHIYTPDHYSDFELRFDWRIEPGGNSGVKYRMAEHAGKMLGPEYQILGERFEQYDAKKIGKNSTASLYAIQPPNQAWSRKPAGAFNTARIIARGSTIEHWLNGELVMSIKTDSDAWATAKQASKFKDVEGFATGPGPIMLQDHGSKVWYRNIRIRVIEAEDGE